jgi:hypothetical protein
MNALSVANAVALTGRLAQLYDGKQLVLAGQVRMTEDELVAFERAKARPASLKKSIEKTDIGTKLRIDALYWGVRRRSSPARRTMKL